GASVIGGGNNTAGSPYSVASGRHANVSGSHGGTFLFADNSTSADFNSAAANEFAARATGGVRFVTAVDSNGNPTAGVQVAAGGGSWSSISDRAAKANVVSVDGREVLARLASIPVTSWNYLSQDVSIRHIG